jgi:hypothetical protein
VIGLAGSRFAFMARRSGGGRGFGQVMDIVEPFPFVYCDTCKKVQPMIFDVLKADKVSDHDAADIVCDECKSVIATLPARTKH